MIDIDITVFIQIASILFLMFLLNNLLFKPIRSILEERQEKLDALKKEMDGFEQKAVSIVENYNQKLNEARQNGVKEKEKFLSEARANEKGILSQSAREAEEKKQRDISEITKAIDSVRSELNTKAEAFANEIVQKVLGRAI
jgi:F-type H+-transporting ATPase subunit b